VGAPGTEPSSDRRAHKPPLRAVNLDSRRDDASWSLLGNLCSIMLLGGQYEGADLDFELSGQPTRITITDEARRILVQREVVVKHCIVEFNLGGAEIQGGLTAMKRAVSAFLEREEASHLLIEVGGSARAPRLTVQVLEGAIGLARPLVRPRAHEEEDDQPTCWLAEVKVGTKVSARVWIYGAELQDQEPSKEALSGAEGDQEEPAIGRRGGNPLKADDRIRIMTHLWKLAAKAEQDPENRAPGVLSLS
jgi:hypothetical protein